MTYVEKQAHVQGFIDYLASKRPEGVKEQDAYGLPYDQYRVTPDGQVLFASLQTQRKWDVWEAALSLADTLAQQPVPHPDSAAISAFADCMKIKMRMGREAGRGGWQNRDECTDEHLARRLVEQLAKGNTSSFVDLANYAMMLSTRGAHPSILSAVWEQYVHFEMERRSSQMTESRVEFSVENLVNLRDACNRAIEAQDPGKMAKDC